MSLDFLRPYFLLLLPLLILLRFYPVRAPWSTVVTLRALVFGLLIVALAGPVFVGGEKESAQVLVLDGTASVGEAKQARLSEVLRGWRAELRAPERATIVVLGEVGAGVLNEAPDVPVVRLGGDGSPLGAALEAALRRIPAGSAGALTFVSDGLSTERHWGPALSQLIERGIPVKVLGLENVSSSPSLVGLREASALRVGRTAQLEAVVCGEGRGLQLRLLGPSGGELGRSAAFDCSGRQTLSVSFEPAEAGSLEVRAELLEASSGKPLPVRGSLTRLFAVQPPLRLLYLGGRGAEGANALSLLLGRGFSVQDGSSLQLDARTPLSNWDLVMLDDRPASQLPAEFQENLASAVRRDGLGLLCSGGRAAYSSGGYDGTPLADLLPVDLEQRSEKQDPSTALVLIVDTSGSMMGNRIEIAKQVARLAARRLKAHDRIGIVEFYGNKHWALPLQSAANKSSVDRAIGRMQATGGTVLYPALEEAYYGLKNVTTRFKHIVLLTDAGVEDADYEGLVRRIARDSINVSTVLVGGQAHSKSLLDIANWGNGRFYGASDRYALPEILLKQASSSLLPSYKPGSFGVRPHGGRTWWGETEPASLPSLSGYVETRLRPTAELLLEVADTGAPALASWQCGAGRVTALMTEALGDGTRSWRDWAGYGQWLARLADRTAGDLSAFSFEAERRDGMLTLLARSRFAGEELHPAFKLQDEHGAWVPGPSFARLAPDWFEATLPFSEDRALSARVYAEDGQGRVRGAERFLALGARSDQVPELQVDPLDALPLERLAQVTGGSFRPFAGGPVGPLPQPSSRTSLKAVELGAYAALAALLVYLVEIAWRRRERSVASKTSFRA